MFQPRVPAQDHCSLVLCCGLRCAWCKPGLWQWQPAWCPCTSPVPDAWPPAQHVFRVRQRRATWRRGYADRREGGRAGVETRVQNAESGRSVPYGCGSAGPAQAGAAGQQRQICEDRGRGWGMPLGGEVVRVGAGAPGQQRRAVPAAEVLPGLQPPADQARAPARVAVRPPRPRRRRRRLPLLHGRGRCWRVIRDGPLTCACRDHTWLSCRGLASQR